VLTIKIDVDQETYERLVDEAVSVRRPTPRHAGVVIRRALGLPFPELMPGRLTTHTDPACEPDPKTAA
jgi:hypothetical protein